MGGPLDDYGNGLSNLAAYGTKEPATFINNAGVFTHTYQQRIDDPNLSCLLQGTTDLVNVPFADNGYAVAIGTKVTGDAYDVVTNSIPTTADETFVRLKVTNP